VKQQVIEHATRKISFSTDELKLWTKEDEILMKAYISLHDKELLLKAQAKELLSLSADLNKQTEKVRLKLIALKEMIAAISKLADGFIVINPNRQHKANEISKEAKKLNAHIRGEYHSILSELELTSKTCSEKNEAFINDTEDDELWDAYSDIKHSHFHNYEINAIDIVSFDKDDDTFRSFASVWRDHNKGIIDYANEAIGNYSKLILETEMQYALWEEFLKRLSLIRMVTATETGEISASSN
jgi:hypothetical protein